MDLISLTQIIAIFVLPVMLIQLNIIPVKQRFWVLLGASLLLLGIIVNEQWSLQKLGITLNNFDHSLYPYLILTLLGGIGILIFANIFKRQHVNKWWTERHFLYAFIPISILQEFAYRGFLMPKLEEMFSSLILVLLINTILFTYLHVVFPNKKINLPLIFCGGLGFSTVYYFYPNLILVSLSHMILNFLAVLYGFFSFRRVN